MVDAPYYWHFMNTRIWPRLVKRVGILRGTEANIKNINGKIDCIDLMLTFLDLVIADFHETVFVPQDKATNAEAMIAMIVSGNVHIISHPGNPKFSIDIQAVTQAAAKYSVALEINNSSFILSRKDSEVNCCEIATPVRDTGDIVALGSDSHTAFTLGEFSECQKILDDVEFPIFKIFKCYVTSNA